MSRIGILCPPNPGHLYPTAAIAAALREHGHTVIYYGIADGEPLARSVGLDAHVIGQEAFPEGAFRRATARRGELGLFAGMRFTLALAAAMTHVICREIPDRITAERIDGLLVDQVYAGGGTAAERAGVPFVTIACGIPVNPDPAVPPLFTSWSGNSDPVSRARNTATYALTTRLGGGIPEIIGRYRSAWGLRPIACAEDFFSPLAQISQLTRDLDFARATPSSTFHYVGPFYRGQEIRPAVDFPYERLDGRPLIYASMGTLQNRREDVFHTIAEACQGLDARLVVSLGRHDGSAGSIAGLGEAIVVPYAPQLSLLARAALSITHAGLNTALESLTRGVPLVAVPVTNDQPGVAARVKAAGAAEVIALRRLSAPALRGAIERVLTDDRYRLAARALQRSIELSGGAAEAATIVERALRTERPVCSGEVV